LAAGIYLSEAPSSTIGYCLVWKILYVRNLAKYTVYCFATGVIDTGGKGINNTGSRFFPPVPLVLLTPVSTIPNFPPVYQRHRLQICHRCRRWQEMRTISGCRHLKVNLKAKNYIYGNSTTQRCPNKISKVYLIEDFFPFATGVNDTGDAP
jgi:hypothetical protein